MIDAPETAAQMHAHLRSRSGFDINQLAAEYRALRASVLRLWIDDCLPDSRDLDEIIRFNEAMDQAPAESIDVFIVQVDQASQPVSGNAWPRHAAGQERCSPEALLDDLLDFNRTTLGLRINLGLDKVDLANLLTEELTQLCAAHPGHGINLEASPSS